jgi:hypothetical protein
VKAGGNAVEDVSQNRLSAKKLAEEKARARTLARAQAVAEKLSTATEEVASAIAEANSAVVELEKTMHAIASGAEQASTAAEESRAALLPARGVDEDLVSNGIALTASNTPTTRRIAASGAGMASPTLKAALWQRFAAEVAGLIHPARCPAPNCGRWFSDAARSDKRYCSNACRNRMFRRGATT